MKKRKLIISILAGILAFVMLLSLVSSVLPSVFAKSSTEIQEEIDGLKDQQAELQGQMEALQEKQAANRDETEDIVGQKDQIDQEINLLHTQIENVNSQIQSYSSLIAGKQSELDAAEQNWEDLSEKNKDRVRAMEEEGKLSYWSVLFKSHSFTDFLDRLHMMDEIAAADERRLIELDEAAKVVASAREELAQGKAELQTSRDELDVMQAELDEKRAESDEILKKLEAQAREMKSMYAEYEAMEDDLVTEIANAEAAYTAAKKAEEEAAEAERRRQEALAQQQQQQSYSSSGSSGGSSAPVTGGWAFPCAYGVLTCAYGYRTHPVTGQQNSFHTGVDLAAASGTSIYASRSGTVTTATYSSVYGYYVVINHGDGFSTLYGHMTNFVVSPGEYVSAGQTIGYMGSTGWSTGPHLHFTIYYNGSTVNPMNYI